MWFPIVSCSHIIIQALKFRPFTHSELTQEVQGSIFVLLYVDISLSQYFLLKPLSLPLLNGLHALDKNQLNKDVQAYICNLCSWILFY